jgi:hypothetical protein
MNADDFIGKSVISKSEAGQFQNLVQEAKFQKKTLDFEIAKLVYQSKNLIVTVAGGQELPLYRFYKFDSWADYAKEVFDMKYSTLISYVDIYKKFGAEFEKNKNLKMPGVHKLKFISPLVHEKNAKKMIEHANKTSFKDLQKELNRFKIKPGQVSKTNVCYRINEVDESLVKSAVEIAKTRFNEPHDGLAFTAIIKEWMSLIATKGQAKTSIQVKTKKAA